MPYVEGQHALPLIGAVTAKLASLNWGDIFIRIAPIALTIVVVAGGMVTFYGDLMRRHIVSLVDTKLSVLELRMKRYTDVNREGRFTGEMFDAQMIHRDKERGEIAKKQDEVREKLIAKLRTDLERLSAEYKAHSRNNHRIGIRQ